MVINVYRTAYERAVACFMDDVNFLDVLSSALITYHTSGKSRALQWRHLGSSVISQTTERLLFINSATVRDMRYGYYYFNFGLLTKEASVI